MFVVREFDSKFLRGSNEGHPQSNAQCLLRLFFVFGSKRRSNISSISCLHLMPPSTMAFTTTPTPTLTSQLPKWSTYATSKHVYRFESCKLRASCSGEHSSVHHQHGGKVLERVRAFALSLHRQRSLLSCRLRRRDLVCLSHLIVDAFVVEVRASDQG